MTTLPNFQKNGLAWTDESDYTIPFNRVSKFERVKEAHAAKIYKSAIKINDMLNQFMVMIIQANEEVNEEMNKENKLINKKVKTIKKSFTWFNFDRSVKIEVVAQDSIRFDEAKISVAQELLYKFIDKKVVGTEDMVRQFLNRGFVNSKGALDTKKIFDILSFRSKIQDAQFQSVLNLIQDGISRHFCKRYYRVWVKNEEGAYENIELNFSSI